MDPPGLGGCVGFLPRSAAVKPGRVTIVLALPLLTAALVGLTARSQLPLVARLD
jgi:hypothetical protein